MTLVNDATAAGVGEVRRGAGRGHGVVLHLHADAGIGGAVFTEGVPVRDAQGAGGEFGHMPLAGALSGNRRRCHCGAYGCWDLDVGNLALVGDDDATPRPSVRRAAGRVLARARAGEPAALDRVTAVATALGQGIGALVNGYDPELVTLSGAAATIADLAGDTLRDAYRDGLMGFRRAAPPAVRTSALAGRGQRAGTAELAFDLLLTERLLHTAR
jgi:predicted NBD/HSP70 family sugar kinase